MTKKPTRLAPYKRIALYTVLLLSVCLLAFSASRYLQKQAEEKNSGRRRLAFAPAVEKDVYKRQAVPGSCRRTWPSHNP